MTMTFNSRIPARRFGFATDKTIPGFQPLQQPPAAPALLADVDEDHVFEESFLKDLVLWWTWDDTRTPLYVSGPTGCGKTTSIVQFLARVNAPVISVTCSRRFVKDDLVGRWGARQGGFAWFDGPATLAWKTGAVLLINEFSLAPPEVWVGANDIFEGQSITLEKTGQAVARHPNARVVITDNCRCAAAPEFRYGSRNLQDASTSDRFWHMTARWPDEAVESRIVLGKCTRIAAGALDENLLATLSTCAAHFAKVTRRQSAREDLSSSETIAPVSTRVLVRLTEILTTLLVHGQAAGPALQRAVGLALGSALAPAASLAMIEFAAFEFAPLLELAKAKRRRTRSSPECVFF